MQTLNRVFLFGWVLIFSCAQKPAVPAEKTKWLTLQEAADQLQKEKRPVLIDLYTDWCGWCKAMDKRTYSNKKVSEYLGQKFYPVKIDAESKQSFIWQGKKYDFQQGQGANSFAIYLTNGQLSYPTTVFIPIDGEPQAIPGFLAPNEFELLARYFGEGHFGKTDFGSFQKSFKSTW